jgi:hypothetical protein
MILYRLGMQPPDAGARVTRDGNTVNATAGTRLLFSVKLVSLTPSSTPEAGRGTRPGNSGLQVPQTPESVFPHQLRPGDIVTDDRGQEWEVVGYPSVYNQGKSHQVRVQKPGDPSTKSSNFYPAHVRVAVKRQRPGGEVVATKATVSTRTELLVRDGDGKLVYRLTLPCDPIEDTTYLAALVAGEQVAAIACERPGDAKVFYARSLDELRAWAEKVRDGRL